VRFLRTTNPSRYQIYCILLVILRKKDPKSTNLFPPMQKNWKPPSKNFWLRLPVIMLSPNTGFLFTLIKVLPMIRIHFQKWIRIGHEQQQDHVGFSRKTYYFVCCIFSSCWPNFPFFQISLKKGLFITSKLQ